MDAWGKFKSPSEFHRLEHHCADVAACFEALLLDPVLQNRFEKAAGNVGCTRLTRARLAVLAFLHDFAKLNAGFQFKVRDRSAFPTGLPPSASHIPEALVAPDEILKELGLFGIYSAWGDAVDALLHATLSHHGRPVQKRSCSGKGPAALWKPFANYDPLEMAALLGERIRAWFPEAFEDGPRLPDTPALAHLFAGVVVLADQIGSNAELFEYEPDPDPHYMERARDIAAAAVAKHGFRRGAWPSKAVFTDISILFGHSNRHPMQRAVQEAPLDCPLLILESETGSGKTEAAILRFVELWRTGLVDGLYFAVPTRAAAKQLHVRIHEAMKALFPVEAQVATVLAIPGYCRAGDTEGQRSGRFEVFWDDEPDEDTRLARWSAECARKFLSAPVAVGTVDQVLLAGLRVKWAHFRAAALARSLLVVDEVHASDAYMTELLRTVLQGHLELGGHALLMSATLGADARTKLATRQARACLPSPAVAEAAPYPALTLADSRGGMDTREISGVRAKKRVSMRLGRLLGEPVEIATRAFAAARSGAKVLVIRNTVTSAQEVFHSLLDRGGEGLALKVEQYPTLHHSRFAAEDRGLLDDAVVDVLGKDRASGGVVVIGTQTLEQSLDIDADLLISDICPVDVLLQRIGRLHRHPRADRPQQFRDPCCVVMIPDDEMEKGLDGSFLRHGLGVSNSGGIYRNLLVLEATRRLIADQSIWTIPDMNRMLVERATHPHALRELAQTLGGRWLSHEQKTFGLSAAEARLAQQDAFTRNEAFDDKFGFHDKDEKVRTRLGEDGPRIILADPVPGPFGSRVRTFNLPAHLFRGIRPGKADIDGARAEVKQDGLILRIGNYQLNYDRTGIRPV